MASILGLTKNKQQNIKFILISNIIFNKKAIMIDGFIFRLIKGAINID